MAFKGLWGSLSVGIEETATPKLPRPHNRRVVAIGETLPPDTAEKMKEVISDF